MIPGCAFFLSVTSPKLSSSNLPTEDTNIAVQRVLLIGVCIFFILLGCLFIPYPGIQNDEALFSGPLYAPAFTFFRIRIFRTDIPAMSMSYLGALKTWVFSLVLLIWKPSQFSLRLPPLLLGSATVWMFFKLLDRVAGRWAAWTGCVLLATDPIFLLTNCFDWGPVAIQHVCLVGGSLSVVRFHQEQSRRALAAGFFLFGLGLWDKALFSWLLIGLGAGVVVLYSSELRRAVTLRNVRIAFIAFVLGALPLIIYNVKKPLQTFRGNASLSSRNLEGKWIHVRLSLEGSSLFGYMAGEEWDGRPKPPGNALERGSVWLRGRLGEHRRDWMPWAVILSLLMVPFWWRTPGRRPVLFAVIFLSVAWVMMGMTRDAGGAVHHVMLLWPFPQFLVAISLAEGVRRLRHAGIWMLTGMVAVLAIQGLLVTNQYLAQFATMGATGSWTDAIYPLARDLLNYKDRHIYVIDWGMLDSLKLLDQGQLPLRWEAATFNTDQPTDRDHKNALKMFEDPTGVFLSHVAGREEFAGVGEHIAAMARAAGYEKETLQIIPDSNGRPVFELFRFKARNS